MAEPTPRHGHGRAPRGGVRLFGAFALLGFVGLVGWVGAPRVLDEVAEARCEGVSRARDARATIALCAEAWERTASPRAAGAVALAHLHVRDVAGAERWAALEVVREHPRGRLVRGYLLSRKNAREEALAEFERALADALDRGEADDAGRAAHGAAGVHWAAGRYSAAFEAAELAEQKGQEAGDGATVGNALLAKADIYRHIGDAQRADEALSRAVEATREWPSQQAFALLKQGMFLMERDMHARAREQMERALALARQTDNHWVLAPALEYVAELRIRDGDVAGARTLWETAGADGLAGDADGWVPGLIARAEGRHADALVALTGSKRRDRLPSVRLQFELELADLHRTLGQNEEAEAAWRRAVALAEGLTAAEPVHQGWVVARRRAPFDRLFAHLVTQGRHEEAWEVLVGYTRSEALALEPDETSELRQRLAVADELTASWRGVVDDGEAKPDAALQRPRELLVLHEAEGRLWAGLGGGGRVRFVEVAALDDIADALHTFRGNPADERSARVVGEAVWRAAALGDSKAPLFVVATGRLHGLAFAALQAEGQHWVRLRPIARLAHLGAEGAAAGEWTTELRALGDPLDDLPGARAEVEWVASHLGGRAVVGVEAKREAVLDAVGISLLHIAAHAEVGPGGVKLQMADGPISPLEVLQRRPRARLVVLASCASTAGREAAGSDSLATAFLRAGSGAVLATVRSVPDEAAQQLVRAFYAHGGAEDPVRALARAQGELSRSQPVQVWSAFVVIVGAGHG